MQERVYAPSRVVKEKIKFLVVPTFVEDLNKVLPPDTLSALSISTNVRRSLFFRKHSATEEHKVGIYTTLCKSFPVKYVGESVNLKEDKCNIGTH